MIALFYKLSFWLRQSLFNAPAPAKSEPKQTNGKVEFPGPIRHALCFAAKLIQTKTGFIDSVSANWANCQRLIYGPTILQSPAYQRSSDSGFLRPFANSLRSSLKRNDHVAFYISLLSLRRCPAAILRAVAELPIYSINRRPIWALPHIFQKVLKGFSPSVANHYADRAVLVKFPMTGTMASTYHVLISCIRSTLGSVGCMPMFFPDAVRAKYRAIRCYARSISLKRSVIKLGIADWASGYCHELILPNKARVGNLYPHPPGLTKRRKMERDLCLS